MCSLAWGSLHALHRAQPYRARGRGPAEELFARVFCDAVLSALGLSEFSSV